MDLYRKYSSISEQLSSEKLNHLKNWLQAFFEKRVNSRWIDERRCIPPYVVTEFARMGIFGFHVAENNSGLGLTASHWVDLIGQLGHLDSTISQLVAINALATRPIVAFGTADQKSKMLSSLASGQYLACFAQTEDQAGTNFTSIETIAVKNSDNNWLVNGNKVWIGNAGWSNLIILIAQTRSETHEDLGLTAFAVPTDTPGVDVGEELNTMGLRGVVQNRIAFRDVKLQDTHILGNVGDGMEIAVDAMSFTRLLISAQQIGLMKKAIQIIYTFASKRQISTGLLIDNAVGLNKISECIARVETCEQLLKSCAQTLDKGNGLAPELSSICKILSTEFAGYITDTVLQLLGGRGYEENNILPQLVRDTRVTRIFEGPTEALAAFCGARIDEPRFVELLSCIECYSLELKAIWGEVEDKIQDLKADLAESPFNEEQSLQFIHYKMGVYCSYGVLTASYKSCQDLNEDIETWLETGPGDAPSFVQGHCLLSKESIHRFVEKYTQELGAQKQQLPGINNTLDTLF